MKSTYQFDVAILGEHDVFRLEISVNDALRVKVLYGDENLRHVERRVGLVQRSETVQKVEQLSTLDNNYVEFLLWQLKNYLANIHSSVNQIKFDH